MNKILKQILVWILVLVGGYWFGAGVVSVVLKITKPVETARVEASFEVKAPFSIEKQTVRSLEEVKKVLEKGQISVLVFADGAYKGDVINIMEHMGYKLENDWTEEPMLFVKK